MKVKFPLGESSFESIREKKLFYIDKTPLIEELYRNNGTKVFLFTRPRRFGKTLTMSMLSSFFDISKDSRDIFDGLNISRNKEVCNKWMNKFPTVFVSFKDVDGLSFDIAYGQLKVILKTLFRGFKYLLDSSNVDASDKKDFMSVCEGRAQTNEVMVSLSLLIRMLHAHYGKKVILLIDEYDVPMAKASEKGYYPEMLDVMKGILSVLKDSTTLEFGVVTGCLRIAKESIFTGLNNLYSNTITNTAFSEYFGFTANEVERTFKDLGVEDKLPLAKEWYDGYLFGKSEIYSPWDVISYLNDLKSDSDARPKNYWANTSGNAIIGSFIQIGRKTLFDDIDALLNGESIIKSIDENITYDYLHSTDNNFWSILLMTGYLTVCDGAVAGVPLGEDETALRIPNREVKSVFSKCIVNWVQTVTEEENLWSMAEALWKGDAETVARDMTMILNRTLSYNDVWHEYVYHLFFAGLFCGIGYRVDSNKEYGMGKPDIVVLDYRRKRAAVFELKGGKERIDDAVAQIERKKYIDGLDGYGLIMTYGVRFDGKSAHVVLKDRIER